MYKMIVLFIGSICHLSLAGHLLGLHIDSDDVGSSSSETSLDFYQTTRSYIPEGTTHHIQEESTHNMYLACVMQVNPK
jgi:hypothetical protein